MSQAEEYDQKDLEFLKYPSRGQGWPHWPWCPVKRYVDNNLETGVVYDGKPTVCRGLFVHRGWDQDEYNKAVKQEYGSWEEMLKDGWMVD